MPSYEMLWDCSSCGTTKLLGKTHRRCPNCGAPQDPTRRYFPAPGEEVLAANHVFVGVDWVCAACTTPNSRAASFCVNCGNPRDGNVDVKRVADLSRARPVPLAAPRRSRIPLIIAGLLAAIVAVTLVAVFWQREVDVVVEQHTWARDIDIERFEPRRESAWCDAMPFDAYSVSRSREVRSHRDVADGQSCHTERVDDGDGTFHTEEVCTTKYRSEPIYDDKCHYTVDRWGVARTVNASGTLVQPRVWPSYTLSRTGTCRGCERQGARREALTLALRATKDRAQTWRCDVDEGRWLALRDGDVRPLRVRVVTGGAVCASLQPRR